MSRMGFEQTFRMVNNFVHHKKCRVLNVHGSKTCQILVKNQNDCHPMDDCLKFKNEIRWLHTGGNCKKANTHKTYMGFKFLSCRWNDSSKCWFFRPHIVILLGNFEFSLFPSLHNLRRTCTTDSNYRYNSSCMTVMRFVSSYRPKSWISDVDFFLLS